MAAPDRELDGGCTVVQQSFRFRLAQSLSALSRVGLCRLEVCGVCECVGGECGEVTARIIRFSRVAAVPERASTDIPVLDPESFSSVCPMCKDARVQAAYTRRSLLRLLLRNRPIDAYCVICNQYWPISAQERARLAEDLG
jgi:hypothetical protein